jgi:beta-fructofuranosidase
MSETARIDPRRLELAADPHRPAYHYLAPANWMNDPNGTIFWRGRYHVFYQYNPHGAFWGTMHWGHASSADLLHWDDHPIALAPTPGGPDRDGCFSGAAFVSREGVPTFIYHGVPEGICLASSHDDLLLHWEKHPANPVIPDIGPDGEYLVTGAPCAWVEGNTTYAVTGNSIHTPDRAYLFASTDLAHWQYRHPFYEGGKWTGWGEDCGCPDFFPLGNKHVLLFTSHLRGAQYYIGSLSDHRFIPERHGRLAFSTVGRPGVFNEGLTLLDGQGRRILFGRMHEGRYGTVQRAAGWAGILALPMVLSLAEDGDLRLEPVPELQALRRQHRHLAGLTVAAGQVLPLDICGDRLEIRAVYDWEGAEEFGLKVRCSPDGAEQTQIRCNVNPWQSHPAPARAALQGLQAPELILDVSRSSGSAEVSNRESERCRLALYPGELLELRVFVDRSVVEVFANGRQYLAKRIYPARKDSLDVQAFAMGGAATLRSLDVWEMEAVWPVE